MNKTLQEMGYDQYFRRPLPQEYQQYSAVNYDALFEDGSIIQAKLEDGSVTSVKIQSIKFDQIEGGTATLGGSNNKSGQLSVRDEQNNEKVLLNKDGITVNDGSITINGAGGNSVIDETGLVSTSNFPSFSRIVFNDSGNIIQNITTDATYTTVTNGTQPCSFSVTVSRPTKIVIIGRSDINLNCASGESTLGNLGIFIGSSLVEEAYFNGDNIGGVLLGYASDTHPTTVNYVGQVPTGTTFIYLKARLNRLAGTPDLGIYSYNFSYFLLGT